MEAEIKIHIKDYLVIENEKINDPCFTNTFKRCLLTFEESNFKIVDNSLVLATVFIKEMNLNYNKQEK